MRWARDVADRPHGDVRRHRPASAPASTLTAFRSCRWRLIACLAVERRWGGGGGGGGGAFYAAGYSSPPLTCRPSRAGSLGHQHLRAGLWCEERHCSPRSELRRPNRQALRLTGRDPEAVRPRRSDFNLPYGWRQLPDAAGLKLRRQQRERMAPRPRLTTASARMKWFSGGSAASDLEEGRAPAAVTRSLRSQGRGARHQR